ncbi:hypothetical protein [Saccharopolyspora gregorii]|uniref:hypothetical protein n=1 Tax=Saccharopolyspora gregorii TaxID=33914 RepID=UPI002814D718|nr:hypothetical protein [Saccharopolyspora gregorii]
MKPPTCGAARMIVTGCARRARNLILADMPTAPGMSAPDAAQAAGLLLARTDAGILENQETHGVRHVIRDVLTPDTLTTLRRLWRHAHTVADDDAETMLDLGRQWCEAIGTDPDTTPPATSSASTDHDTSGTPSPLAGAVRRTVNGVARHVAREIPPGDGSAVRAATQSASEAAEQAAQHAAATAARNVFGKEPGDMRTGSTGLAMPRTPTPDERRAARTLARALSTAGVTERHATRTTAQLPPGRLRMRGALAADAQRAAGHLPTAEPFTRTTRRLAPAPPLRVGIACDVTSSMRKYTDAVASAAWIMAHATRHTTVPADAATVIFGHHVRAVTYPGTAPRTVTEFRSSDSYHDIPGAICALDGILGLTRPDTARLLVIISDGCFDAANYRRGQQLLDRLRTTGCGLLWLTTKATDKPMTGTTVHELTDPTTTAAVIGRAATTALKHATR